MPTFSAAKASVYIISHVCTNYTKVHAWKAHAAAGQYTVLRPGAAVTTMTTTVSFIVCELAGPKATSLLKPVEQGSIIHCNLHQNIPS